MRLSRTRSGLACAGLTTGAMVAAVLVAPSAAFAAALTSITPIAGPVGTTITATLGAAHTGDAVGATFSAAATACPAFYNTTAPNVAATNVGKISDTKVTLTVPNSLTLNASNGIKAYAVCIYTGTTAGTSPILNETTSTSSNTFTLTPGGTVNPNTGASGGGNTVTLTLPSTAALVSTTPGVAFNPNGCAATLAGTGNIGATTITRTSPTVVSATVPANVLGTGLSTPYYMCLYNNAGNLVASGSTPYNVTVPATTLSQPIGPSGTTTNLTLTSPSNIYATATAPYALFVSSPTATPATCPTLFQNTATFTTPLRKLANNKAALSLPSGPVISGTTPTPFLVCQYSSNSTTTGRLLSVATYTIAAVPTVTGVSPNRGSALGGQTITVTGTNFPTTGLTATLGGSPLGNINVLDSSTFTATTPAHATGSVTVAVSTPVGSDTLSGGYTYANSIQVSPNTAPNTVTAQDVDVQGVGFLDYTFTGGGKARVYLVDGVYNDRVVSGAKVNGPVANCGFVLVISDVELVCSLDLTAQLNAAGTTQTFTNYRTTPTGTSSVGTNVLTLSTGTFTQQDVGLPIGGTLGGDFGTNPYIVAVTSPTTAIISNNSTVGVGSATALTVGSTASVTATGGTTGPTLTGAVGAFKQSDVGKAVTAGGGIAANTVITAVDATGEKATLSVTPSGAVAGPVTLTSGNPVPNGAYNITVVSNGTDANASTADPTYRQTEISSGSTFTVAPF